MFHRAAALTTILISFTLTSLAQRDPFSSQRPFQGAGQDMFNSLAGTVVTADNKPVKDAHVELRGSNGSAVSSAYTNSSGMFEFPQVSPGTYDIVATSGVEQAQERIEVGRIPFNVSLRLPVTSSARDGNGSNSVSVAQYKVPQKAREALKKAQEATAKEKNDEAQKQLAKALEIYPKYADALTLRAILKMGTKDLPDAVADLQQAITDDENCALAYLVMGAIFNTESKFDDAIRSLQRGEALSPNSWQGYFEMGKALVGKAQYEPALRQLDRAQTLVPKDYPSIHLVKAHAMLALNDYSDAMTELQAYLTIEPQGPNTQEAQKMLAQARAFAATHEGK
jgi:tetratricopeptide (TPR) repeat protein